MSPIHDTHAAQVQLSPMRYANIASDDDIHGDANATDMSARVMPDISLIPVMPQQHAATSVHGKVQAQPKVQPQTVGDASGCSSQAHSHDSKTYSGSMHSIFAVAVLPAHVLAHPSNSTLVPGGMPPLYIDAIRDVLLFTFQSQFALMQLSIDGLSHQFASLHINVHNEVTAVSQKVDTLESSLA